MNQRKILSILLFVIVSISSFGIMFTAISGEIPDNRIEKTNSIDKRMDLSDPTNIYDESKNISPESAAYYRDLAKINELLIDSSGIGTNLTIKAGTQNSSHIFLTGYTMVGANRSLCAISIRKSDNFITKKVLFYESITPLNATYNTLGLTIAIDNTQQILFIGGAYDLMNASGQLKYETYGAGIIAAYNSSTMSFMWCISIANSLDFANGDIDTDGAYIPWHFGGERVEYIYPLGNGEILVTGAYSYQRQINLVNRYAVNAFRARINSTGHIKWNQLEGKISLDDTTSISIYYTSVGRKIIYNPISDKYFILVEEKLYDTSYSAYQMQSYLYSIDLSDGDKLPNVNLNIIFNGPNYFTQYFITLDVAVDTTGNMWAYGENRTLTNNIVINRTRVLTKLDKDGNYLNENTYFAGMNYTAKNIIIDQNNTMYLIGESLNNNTSQVVYWYYNLYDIYRIGQPLYQIDANLDNSGTNGIIANSLFDNSSKNLTIVATTYSTPQGLIKNYASGSSLNIGIMGTLPQYSNTQYIYLNWTMPDSRARYYYLYRNTSSIEPEDIPFLTPIAVKEWSNQHIDYIASPIDGMVYYYAVLSGTDANNATTISTSSTQYFKNPDKPIIELYPSTKILAGNVVRIYTKYSVGNATLNLYGKIGIFTAMNIPTMTPISTSTNGTINTYITLNNTGIWYFMVQAVNSSRGNSTSDLVSISVENIAVSPTSLIIEDKNTFDGEVSLYWSRTVGVKYDIYVKTTKFTSRDINQIAGLTPVNPDYINSNEYTVTGLGSGTFYFAILGTNSSGNATDIAYTTDSVTITLIPFQPELIITTQFNNDGVNKLVWTASPETKYYLVYRAYSEIDSVLCEKDVSKMTLIYNGTDVSLTNVVQEEGYYFYAVIAVNDNGQRAIDCELGAIARVAWEQKPDNNLYYGLIAGGAIFAVVMVIYGIYKKNNPY